MSSLGPAMGSIAIAIVVAAYVVALQRMRVAETTRGASPWFGYARDGVNLGASALMLVAYALAGFPGPLCLLCGLSLTLLVYLCDWLLGKEWRWSASGWVVAPLCAGMAIASMIAAPTTISALQRLLATAAPR